MTSEAPPPGMVAVQIIGLPVPLYREASEHNEGLLREFALILRSNDDDGSVPARLLHLMDELRASFGAFTAQPSSALAAAVARGDERIDLVYHVPPEAREAVLRLSTLLDEADAFCRAGEHLLSLETPSGAAAFRRWFLGEFVAQIDGAAPTPWPGLAASGGATTA